MFISAGSLLVITVRADFVNLMSLEGSMAPDPRTHLTDARACSGF
jgi:hypothetical protein